jgi:hypothetical protein
MNRAAPLTIVSILILTALSTAVSAGQQSESASTTGSSHVGANIAGSPHDALPTKSNTAGTTVVADLRVDRPIKVQLVNDAQTTGSTVLSVVKVVGPPIVSLIAVLVTLVALRNAAEATKKTLLQKDREDERKEIRERLTTFFGPMQQLLAVSKRLTEVFKNGAEFRTLLRLLEGTTYTDNDALILDEIITVTSAIEKLITRKSGLVEDSRLRTLLSEAAAHFRVLRLARSGKLKGETDRFAGLVYPKDLEAMIDNEIESLNQRLAELAVTSADGRA